MAVEQVAEGVELADAPFRDGGQAGLDYGELGESGECPPAASGAALLNLGGPDRPDGRDGRKPDLPGRRGLAAGPPARPGPAVGEAVPAP